MSQPKSQSQSNLDNIERTTTAKSFNSEPNRVWETLSILSTRTHDSYKAAFFNFMRDFKKKYREKYKNKNYQYVIRVGARRWNAMSQADRAPYILEAARNRRTAKSHMSTRNTQYDKKRQDTDTKEYRSRSQRCPACGHRKKSRQGSCSSSNTSLISSQTGSSKSSNSGNQRKIK